MDIKELGNQIAKIRKARQLNQEELGKLVGISRNYISLIERGEARNVSLNVVNQIANALGITVFQLTGDMDNRIKLMIPLELREFGLNKNLTYETIDKLASIPRRGQEPKSVKEWQELYEAISEYIK